MNATLQTIRPGPAPAQEALPDPSYPFRERIAERNGEYVAAYPRAADLEARTLLALHGALNGSAVQLRGLHSPQRFRDAIVGLKNFPLSDLCRLACEPVRESRAAVKAVAQVLAAAVGYRLEPMGNAANAQDALTGLMETGTAFAVDGVRALADGLLDPSEARALRPRLEQVKANAAKFDAILSAAEQPKAVA